MVFLHLPRWSYYVFFLPLSVNMMYYFDFQMLNQTEILKEICLNHNACLFHIG